MIRARKTGGSLSKLARRAGVGAKVRRGGVRAVLIDARRPMNYSVIAPIYNRMRGDPRIRFYFVASEQPGRARQIYREAGNEIEIISPRQAFWMKFDVYLVADVLWLPLPRGARRVMMFHGVAGKYSDVYDSPSRSMREWDRLFFINKRRLRNFISAGAIDPDSSAARLVGMPKLDCLVDGSLSKAEILTGLGLDPAKPTVLYAPTWSEHSSLNKMGKKLVAALSNKQNNLIVKLHDGSRMPGRFFSGDVDWVSELTPILNASGGCLANTSDASPLLAAADVLITDHSSVGFEYLLLDRPVVRIHVPELIANTKIGSEYVELLTTVSLSVTEPSAIQRVVEKALADPKAMSDVRRTTASELFHCAGSATQRAIDELYVLLELDPPTAVSSLC